MSCRPRPSGAVTAAPGAARPAAQGGDCSLGLFKGGEHLETTLIVDLSLFGCLKAPRGTVEKPHADIILQFLQTMASYGWRDPQVASRSRKACPVR